MLGVLEVMGFVIPRSPTPSPPPHGDEPEASILEVDSGALIPSPSPSLYPGDEGDEEAVGEFTMTREELEAQVRRLKKV